jgi:hypothetical protein
MKTINAKNKNCFEFIYKGYAPTSLVKTSDPLKLLAFLEALSILSI